MSFPTPKNGLVIRYSFLWSHEKDAGALEGTKDRPCAIVVASRPEGATETTVFVLPVTHREPTTPDGWVEISPKVARGLGLDGDRHWVIVTELNKFIWPGYDLRQIPETGSYAYGMLPEALFILIQEEMKLQIAKKRTRATKRD